MSTEAIAAEVKESGASQVALRITGRSNWLDAGRPVRAEKTLSLGDDTGVVSYVPGDLTLTVRAGTTLSEIEKVTREHDQWLPLDPYGSSEGTIGATLATASAGPLSSNFGLPRDLVLGIEFVTGRGEIVRGGGKVVKNVAGFDLSRLLVGLWGTIGVITEATLRLYALPEVDRTFAIRLAGGEREVGSLLRAIVTSPLSPYALLFLSRSTARDLDLGDNPVCLIRFGGNDPLVRAQVSALSQVSRPEEIQPDTWNKLRELEADAHTVIRVSGLPQRFLEAGGKILTDEMLGEDIPGEDMLGIRTYVDPRRGVLRVLARDIREKLGSNTSVDLQVRSTDSAQVIYEKLDPYAWKVLAPTAVADALSQRIKKTYDPYNILNPGILGDLT